MFKSKDDIRMAVVAYYLDKVETNNKPNLVIIKRLFRLITKIDLEKQLDLISTLMNNRYFPGLQLIVGGKVDKFDYADYVVLIEDTINFIKEKEKQKNG